MKVLMLAVSMMIMSAPSYAEGLIDLFKKQKCYDEDYNFVEKIDGKLICHAGNVYEIGDDSIYVKEENSWEYKSQDLGIYCFNNNYRPLQCRKFKNQNIIEQLNNSETFGTSAPASTVLIDGTVYPVCGSSAIDPDGDSWGWENNRSCKFL